MVGRNRLHLSHEGTPESSVTMGRSPTPTSDSSGTPTGTIYTDDIASEIDSPVMRNAEDQFSSGPSGILIDEWITRSPRERTGNVGVKAGPPELTSSSKSALNTFRDLSFRRQFLLFICTVGIVWWTVWFGQGNVISLKLHVGQPANQVPPTHITSAMSTVTKTIHESRHHTRTITQASTKTTTKTSIETSTFAITKTKTKTSVETSTSTITATYIASTFTITTTYIPTTTVTVHTKTGNASSTHKPTAKARPQKGSTRTQWDPASNSVVKCYHGKALTKYGNFLSRRSKSQRQKALWACLDNLRNGVRWGGVKCGDARWEAEVEVTDGGIYNDLTKCWQRCGRCFSGAIKKALEEAECVVEEDSGSRCVASYM